jgi:hypothetical protein
LRGRSNDACSHLYQPQVSNQQKQKDAPNQMVNVAAIHRNIMERTDIVTDGERECAHHQHGSEKPKRRQEQPLPSRFGEPVLVDPAEPRMRNDRAQSAENRRNQNGQNPKTAVSPKHAYFDLGTSGYKFTTPWMRAYLLLLL